jgi:dihydroorotase
VARDVMMAAYTGGRYHVSRVSTCGSLDVIRLAKSRGGSVTCAASAHHLALSEAELIGYDPNFKLTPPLRHQRDVEALCQGLAEGLIDAIVSDHRPQSNLQKDCEFSEAEPGAVGLSTCFGLLLSLVRQGRVSLGRAVSALTTGPASVLGLPRPALREGQPADLVLVDPEVEWQIEPQTLFSKSRNSPLIGRSLPGRVELTLARGRIAFDRLALAQGAAGRA